jgi:hypothetical protein
MYIPASRAQHLKLLSLTLLYSLTDYPLTLCSSTSIIRGVPVRLTVLASIHIDLTCRAYHRLQLLVFELTLQLL